MKTRFTRFVALAIIVLSVNAAVADAQGVRIDQATLMEKDAKTPEVSTSQLRQILQDGSAIVIDTRPRAEFSAGHIPGARLIDASPNRQIATIEGIVSGNKAAALVLYCNGPFCQASRRMGEQLAAAGFTNVRRYQLGIPVWRALGGPTEIELEGITRIFKVDRTAVFIDARPAEEFAKGSLAGARSMTAETLDATIKGMMAGQLQNAPLPLDDFNRRIVLFGRDAAEARRLAQAMSKRPWHNVVYFPGSYEALASALRDK
jgi:rhodanese-related sulfurtransferase